jgi:hypothetical protein
MTFLLDVGWLVCELTDAGEEAPLAGLQHPPLDVGEAPEVGVDEFLEGLLRGVESPFDLGGRRAQRRGVLVAGFGLGGKRVPEKGLPGDAVWRGTVGRHEGLGLRGPEGMPSYGVGQALLLGVTEGREAHRHGEGEAPGVEPFAQLRREAASQEEPALDPGLLSSEEFRDRRGREPVLVRKRRDHPGFVHGTGGLSGRVGLEESGLASDAGDGLEDHGDLPQAFGPPPGQALESVEDLEGAVLRRRHAQGQGGKIALSIRTLAPERREAHAETIEGDLQDQAHGNHSCAGRIWWRG